MNDEEIQDIITPIVQAEKDSEEFYDNETLYLALKENYPRNLIMQYTIDNINTLTI